MIKYKFEFLEPKFVFDLQCTLNHLKYFLLLNVQACIFFFFPFLMYTFDLMTVEITDIIGFNIQNHLYVPNTDLPPFDDFITFHILRMLH